MVGTAASRAELERAVARHLFRLFPERKLTA
jgi:hypothetical protein